MHSCFLEAIFKWPDISFPQQDLVRFMGADTLEKTLFNHGGLRNSLLAVQKLSLSGLNHFQNEIS